MFTKEDPFPEFLKNATLLELLNELEASKGYIKMMTLDGTIPLNTDNHYNALMLNRIEKLTERIAELEGLK